MRRLDRRVVAIKFLAPDPNRIDEVSFDDVRARFKREGQRGTQLDHYGLVKILAYVDDSPDTRLHSQRPTNPFIIMEMARAGTLESYIEQLSATTKGCFTADTDRLNIALQIAHALEYLHDRDLVHRDVKPANIFLSTVPVEGAAVAAKLGDFGVVKWGAFHRSVTTGTLTATEMQGLGTTKYMAREHAVSSKDVTSKSDVFSLGVSLFELFTGSILPSVHHVYDIVAAHDQAGASEDRWRLLGVRVATFDQELAEFILSMHARSPDRRPTARRVREFLTRQFEGRHRVLWRSPDQTEAG